MQLLLLNHIPATFAKRHMEVTRQSCRDEIEVRQGCVEQVLSATQVTCKSQECCVHTRSVGQSIRTLLGIKYERSSLSFRRLCV